MEGSGETTVTNTQIRWKNDKVSVVIIKSSRNFYHFHYHRT